MEPTVEDYPPDLMAILEFLAVNLGGVPPPRPLRFQGGHQVSNLLMKGRNMDIDLNDLTSEETGVLLAIGATGVRSLYEKLYGNDSLAGAIPEEWLAPASTMRKVRTKQPAAKKRGGKRELSAEARARISQAQKKRWAATRKANGKPKTMTAGG